MITQIDTNIIQTNYDTQSLVYFPAVSQLDGSGIYAAAVVAGVSAIRVSLGTRSFYLVHRQSLWGSLRFQQQECFSNSDGEKGVSMPGRYTASMSMFGFSQWN